MSGMTDHSTARALVMGKIDASERAMIKERKAQYGSRFNREQEENIKASHRQRRIGAEIALEALTPPEGDTVSDEVERLLVEAYKRGWREGCETLIEDYPDALIAVPHKDAMGEGCGTFMAETFAARAALQSRASPQAGMRKALEEARRALGSLDKWALGMGSVAPKHDGDTGYQYPIRDELLAKIDAALSTAPPTTSA